LTGSLRVSSLGHTWLIDVDGVIFAHNGYKTLTPDIPHEDLLPGVREFFQTLHVSDRIILLTARNPRLRRRTEKSLRFHRIRYDALIMGLPPGERILINDRKPSGLPTAVAIVVGRDQGLGSVRTRIDRAL
jgi:hypothetical protein